MSRLPPRFRLIRKTGTSIEVYNMSDSDIIKALGAAVVVTLGAIGVLAERLWASKRKNAVAYDAQAIKRGKAKLEHDREEHENKVNQDQNDYKFLRDELQDIRKRDREEMDRMRTEQVGIRKELMICVQEREFLKARVAFIEDQLLKFTEWKNLLSMARASEAQSLGETKKG